MKQDDQNELPEILILTPVKDASAHLKRYFQLLLSLDYDHKKLSLAFLESDSRDATHSLLRGALDLLGREFGRLELYQHHYGYQTSVPRWSPEIQYQRRQILARSRNRLCSDALRDETWVLWLDVDLVDYPADLIQRMLACDRDILVPHCILPNGKTFDLNTFCFSPDRATAENPAYLQNGLYQPPRGEGRIYLDAFSGKPLVPVDGVGGTVLLINADLHREGLCFPSYAYKGYIETEGLAMMAADMGISCWGIPDLTVVHANA